MVESAFLKKGRQRYTLKNAAQKKAALKKAIVFGLSGPSVFTYGPVTILRPLQSGESISKAWRRTNKRLVATYDGRPIHSYNATETDPAAADSEQAAGGNAR